MLPNHLTPSREGVPPASQLGTFRSSGPDPFPSTQSVTFAPVAKLGSEVLARTRHGSGWAFGGSSVKSCGVPLSSKAFRMLRPIRAFPLAQVSRSDGETSSSWQQKTADEPVFSV